MNPATLTKIQRWIREKKVVELSAPGAISEATQPVLEVTQPVTQREVQRQEVILGNNIEVLRQFPDNTFTAVVTDPPYGLSAQPDMKEVLKHWLAGDDYEHTSNGFMGKGWDSFVPGPKTWEEIMRVLKPGGHILSFSGTRTYDMAVLAMRLAGSEIRDKIDYYCGMTDAISWTHGQGFPKSLSIGKAMDKAAGAVRPVVIDERWAGRYPNGNGGGKSDKVQQAAHVHDGPMMTIIPATEEAKLWEGYGTALKPAHEPIAVFGKDSDPLNPAVPFQYEGKASTKERNLGCENLFWLTDEGNGKTYAIPKEDYDRMAAENETRKHEKGFQKHRISHGNIWPTVKPLDLMRYLVRMVKMPGENLILDPFAGSGTTIVACILEGCGYVGIDMDEVAMRIAEHRIMYAKTHGEAGYR